MEQHPGALARTSPKKTSSASSSGKRAKRATASPTPDPSEGASTQAREAAAEWVTIGELKPWARNPRKNEKAIAKVAESIKRFGFGNPILARRADGEVIAGHTRLQAAQRLGLDRVPVRFLDLDPADAHLLALADNKLGEIAEWDETELNAILSELSAEDADLAGFDAKELERLASGIIAEADADAEGAYSEQYGVIVICSDAKDQERAYEHLQELGYNCKVVVT